MKYSVQSFVEELLREGVITTETGNKIVGHYNRQSNDTGGSRIIGIFGVLGALLVGVGLILIVAHNWDDLTRSTKSVLAILPVILGLASCGYSVIRKNGSFAWNEGSAVFLTFAFGACVALISQIYNMPGSLKGYMLTWTIALIPLIYIMPSRVTSLFYIIGVTSYGCMADFDGDDFGWDRYGHWILLATVIPFYYHLLQHHAKSNTTYFHHWVLPGSIAIMAGTIDTQGSAWLFVVFFALFSCYYLWSSSDRMKTRSLRSNGYRIIGSLGMIILLLMFSFMDNWRLLLHGESSELLLHIGSVSFYISIILTVISGYLLFQKSKLSKLNIMDYAFIVFPVLLFISIGAPEVATILTNLLLLAMAVGTIFKGSEENHLGIVNYGLLIITALVLCRFFDTDIPFVLRGLLFIGVGVSFFFVNYKIIQRRKSLNT